MAELTPEEKEKIYAEEKARLEAQEKVKKEADAKKSKTGCIGIIALLVFIAVVMWICGFFESDTKSPTPSEPLYVDINAAVRFTGTQFIITNNDSFDWKNVELEINPGLLSSGYTLRSDIMKAGQTYTVGALQFAKPDGTRFNPFTVKPQSIGISCATPRGDGYYSGKWK
jgi:hypothetical protein